MINSMERIMFRFKMAAINYKIETWKNYEGGYGVAPSVRPPVRPSIPIFVSGEDRKHGGMYFILLPP